MLEAPSSNITFENFIHFILEFLVITNIIFEKSTEYRFSSHNPDQWIKIRMKTKSMFFSKHTHGYLEDAERTSNGFLLTYLLSYPPDAKNEKCYLFWTK